MKTKTNGKLDMHASERSVLASHEFFWTAKPIRKYDHAVDRFWQLRVVGTLVA